MINSAQARRKSNHQAFDQNWDIDGLRLKDGSTVARLAMIGMQAQVFLPPRNSSSVIASAISYWNIP